MTSETFQCSFLQTHPIAHAGLATDFINDTLADYITMGCPTIYNIGKIDNKLKIEVNSIFFGSAYNLYSEFFQSIPVCTFFFF